ncbi:MAG TPA: M13-type metalloendopeptidase [Steroidobacteraceae bacterium]|nr:M13-type metalloendopeptidase [Steroidobacteraceae bacterium]
MPGRILIVVGSLALLLSAATSGAPLYPPAGLDMSAIDPSTKPGDDFFQYANGTWLEHATIPADRSFITEAQRLRDDTETQLRETIEAAAAQAGHAPVTLAGKVGAFYKSFMDDARREAQGLRPLQKQLAEVRAAKTRAQLAAIMGRSMGDFGGSLFAASIDVDLKDTAHYAVTLSQSGLSLPDRDYYLNPQFAREKREFRDYAARLLALAGWPGPQVQANAIEALESRIAEASWTKAQQRNLQATYNPCTPAALQSFAPGFAWADFLAGAGLRGKQRVIVAEQSAFPKLAQVFADTDLGTLRAWVAYMLLDSAAPYLSAPFADARFHFRDHVLLGIKERPARWKEGIRAVSGGDCLAGGACFGTLNWAVGQLYTAKYFPPATKAAIQALVTELIAAYRARIEHLEWMGPATRAEALRKLDTYVVKVGYPDHPRSYDKVIVHDDDIVGNVRRAAAADWAFNVDRSDGPVDTSDWYMTPQTVDAYNGSLRDIVFPAAILQAPEFDPEADAAVNYGSIGSTIGHELTHGFDDEGRTLDASGALRDWWTPEDAAAFKQRAAVLGAQYATYEPVAGLHINPELTMGENLADLGGLAIALDAYHASLHGQAAPVIDGLTGDQRFFRAFAQGWRGKGREDYIRQLTTSDPHSYRKFRVNGVVRNIDAWYEAFGVQPGDKLYVAPDQRARIW